MLEPHPKLAPLDVYLRRQIWHAAIAFALILFAIGIGLAGYHWIAGLPWIDALLNACMILGGMGPVDTMTNTAAKLFASGYALFGGVVFMLTMGLILTPLVHRLLHRLHIEEDKRRRADAPKTS